MAYVKVNSSQSVNGRLKYIFDESAHDGSRERVLDTTGNHIRLWGRAGRPYSHQSGYYLNTQFKQLRHRAYNPGKRIQAKHMIVSFAESEFSTKDTKKLHLYAHQINQLVNCYMQDNFPESQYVSAVQADNRNSTGARLHAHILINSVATDGRCIRTNKFEINHVRHQWNQTMDADYGRITGHDYTNPFSAPNQAPTPRPKGWQAQLQFLLRWARDKAEDMEEYKQLLSGKGVSIKERNKKGDWSYGICVNGKPKHVRDWYQRVDKKTGAVKATRGVGIEYTPAALSRHFAERQPVPEKPNDLMDALDEQLGLLDDDTPHHGAVGKSRGKI